MRSLPSRPRPVLLPWSVVGLTLLLLVGVLALLALGLAPVVEALP